MAERRRGLGRGLGSLIPTSAPRPEDEAADTWASVSETDKAATTAPGDLENAGDQARSTAQRGSAGQSGSSAQRGAAGNSGSAAANGERPVDVFFPDRVGEKARLTRGDAGSEPAEGGGSGVLKPVPGASFHFLPTAAILPNPRQPRTEFDADDLAELVGSIREVGILQPVVVRQTGPETFELIMGERRLRASKVAGLEEIPAIVRSTSDDDLLRDALLENLHRAELNPLEEAAAYRQLLDDFGCTQDELAKRISRSRPQISNTLRLLKLPATVQRRVAAGVLSAGHARALLGLKDAAQMERLAQRIVAEGISVRSTEEIVSLGDIGEDKKPKSAPRAGGRNERLEEVAGQLSDQLDTRVKINLGKTKGRISIEFATVADLNRIVQVISPESQGF